MTTVTLGDILHDPPGAVALACVSLGWHVFPVSGRTKKPIMRGWPTKATNDVDTVRDWWNGEYANAKVGIVTGHASGIWVLDLDVKNGVNGVKAFNELKKQYDPLPDTFTVRSWSGAGLHLYWRLPDELDIRSSTSVLGRGIDVLGHVKHVRAPLRSADVLVTKHPTDAPDWLVELALNAGKKSESTTNVERLDEWDGSIELTETALRDAEDRVALAGESTRNTTLNAMSFKLAAQSYATGVVRDVAWEHMKAACQHNGLWDEEPEQCHMTFLSGWNAGMQRREKDGNGEA